MIVFGCQTRNLWEENHYCTQHPLDPKSAGPLPSLFQKFLVVSKTINCIIREKSQKVSQHMNWMACKQRKSITKKGSQTNLSNKLNIESAIYIKTLEKLRQMV